MILIRFFLFTLLSYSSLSFANVKDLIIINPGDIYKDFILESFEDVTASLSFDQIKKIDEFKPNSNSISKGYSDSFFWFKFNITNATNSNLNYFIKFTESYIHELDLYIVSSLGETIKYKQGVGYFSDNSLNELEKYQFQINLSSGESKSVYFRILGKYAVFTDVYVLDKISLNNYIHSYDMFYAFCFGAISAMLLSNLFIFFYNREIAYIFYVLYGTIFLCWQLQVNSFPPFNTFPNAFWFYLAGILVPIGIVFLIFFSRALLKTKELFPRTDLLIKFLAYSLMLLAISSVFFLHQSFFIINGLVNVIFPLLLFIGIKSYLSGNKVAIFFVIAQVSFLSFSTLFSLMVEGYIEYNLVNRHGIAVGFVIEIILFSLALAYRIRVLQQEKVAIIYKSNAELDGKVIERTKELEKSQEKLKDLVNRDPMTNLYNRRFLYEVSYELLRIAKRQKQPLSIIMFDIDHFKEINDTYGHSVGDQVIIMFAELLKHTRECDLAARIGGEEFILLLPNTDKTGAYSIATHIRETVENRKVQVKDIPAFYFTISGGVSDFLSGDDNEIDQVLHRADKALYNAKKHGRNRVMIC